MAPRPRPARRPRARPLSPVQALRLLVLRNYIVYRDAWKLFLTGFLEPVFYLFSIGIGVGQLIDTFEFNGEQIPYAEFVAPGMLAASAFNGALIDIDLQRLLQAQVRQALRPDAGDPADHRATSPRGEIAWGQLRGGTYSAGVPRRHGGDGPGRLVVGGARAAGRAPDRVRVQRGRAWR